MSICNFEHIIKGNILLHDDEDLVIYFFLHYYSVFIEISDEFFLSEQYWRVDDQTHRFRCKMMITLDQLNLDQRLII